MSLWAECDIYEFYTNENYAYIRKICSRHRYIYIVCLYTHINLYIYIYYMYINLFTPQWNDSKTCWMTTPTVHCWIMAYAVCLRLRLYGVYSLSKMKLTCVMRSWERIKRLTHKTRESIQWGARRWRSGKGVRRREREVRRGEICLPIGGAHKTIVSEPIIKSFHRCKSICIWWIENCASEIARCPDGKCNRSDSQYAFNYSPHGPNKRRLGHLWQCGPCRQRYLENVSRRRFGIGMSHSQTHSLSLSLFFTCMCISLSLCLFSQVLFVLFVWGACHVSCNSRIATCDLRLVTI